MEAGFAWKCASSFPTLRSCHAQSVKIVKETTADLAAYESVSIRFRLESRVDLVALVESKGAIISERPTAPRWKDYDECHEDLPTVLITRFDASNWAVFAAYEGLRRVGGVLIARDTMDLDVLMGRSDLALILDFRIHPEYRGRGVGRALFVACTSWSKRNGCIELHVETQDTNVAACRFYRAMGCSLVSCDPQGYGDDVDEAKLFWGLLL